MFKRRWGEQAIEAMIADCIMHQELAADAYKLSKEYRYYMEHVTNGQRYFRNVIHYQQRAAYHHLEMRVLLTALIKGYHCNG